MADLDLVSRLSDEERIVKMHSLNGVCPDDAKYMGASKDLVPYLSAAEEWRACARVQKVLLETRAEFKQAEQKHVDEVSDALTKFNPLNASLIEAEVTKHDQLAVIEELGRHISSETKALLHPGTTSYDILDTARSMLFKNAWNEVIRQGVGEPIKKLCNLAEKSLSVLQVGRTHLQDTSPVLFGGVLAGYAGRLAERVEKCDDAFNNLRGKISGIVGTGASVDMVIGVGKSLDFEKVVLKKLGLKRDYTATQIVQKERLADVGHGLTTLMHVLGDFANDMRMLYSSAIGEVTSRDNKERLGGSSADATKNNPINYENIAGKVGIVESGMRVLYGMIASDFQRDLRGSVQARYQPQMMMVETHEAFKRLNKALGQLSINEDKMQENLQVVRDNPSEAMVAILRGHGYVHPEYGVGHDFVKVMGKMAKQTGENLITEAIKDKHFFDFFSENFTHVQRHIMEGRLEAYTGSAKQRAQENIIYARTIAR